MKKILSIAVALVLLIGLIPIAGMMNATAADTWTLVTDASTLQAGDQIVIAANAKDFVAGALSSQYLKNTATTFSSDKTTITALASDAAIFTLSGSSAAWTLTSANGALGATAVKKLAYGSGTTEWTISITADGAATIQNATSTYGRMLYNVSSPRFTTYTSNTSTSMLLPQIYRLVPGGDTDISDNTSSSTTASTSASTTTATQTPSDGDIVFDFGDNGSATHADGTALTAPKDFTSADGNHTLTLETASKVYSGARDALGNSCIKLGTASVVGSFTLTAPEGVTSVVFYVGGYKATAAKIQVNGASYTINTMSNNGEYTAISVDTTTEKTVTFTTVSGGVRCMINSIAYMTGGATVATTTTTTTVTTIYQTPAEIMEAAYALEKGDVLSNSYVYTLSGVITNVDEAYSTSYNNVTVTMLVDGTDRKIQCFRLKGDGADLIGTGDKITVSGVIKNYNGTVEFDSGCTLDAYELSEQEVTIYEGAAAIMDAAYALDAGATLSDGHAYTLTGVITKVNYAYDEGYGNASVTILVDGTDKTIYCYKLAGTGADVVAEGDTITVTGPIKNYNGTVEFNGCTLDSYVVKQEVPEFTGRDVTLGDDLDIGFYVDIPDSVDTADMKIVFTVNDQQKEVSLAGSTGTAVVTLEVPAKDMTTVITASVVDGAGNTCSTLQTTVAEYASAIMKNADNAYTAEQVAAAKAMVNYGAMAQVYFNHNVSDLPNTDNVTDLNAADVSGIADLTVTGDKTNFIGASLVLKSRLAVRLYFTEQVEGAKYNNNGWYVEVTDIDAANLATTQNVTVGETTYSFSALSFAKQVIEGNYGADFQNLMKALVLYEAAAAAL